jgi:tetratricopeptide (TPR) repeat protein
MKRTLLLILFTVLISRELYAQQQQQRVDEYVVQREQMKKAALMREMDSGVYLMDMGKYELADAKFQHVLNNVRSVPSDLTFYFGKNSFQLQKYKQSIDWLTKYIQLKGTNGQFSTEAVDWLRQAEAEYMKEKATASVKAGEVLSTNYDIDCGPAGKVTCPVCKGDHVVIKKGAFGAEYKTCMYCDDHGWLTCDEYNRLLRGELQPRSVSN